MEADEVYSELGDKISAINDKLSEFQGTIDVLHNDITEIKNGLDKLQAAADKQASEAGDAADKQRLDDLIAQIARQNADIAAAQKKADDSAGLLSKLGSQMDDMTKTVTNFPDTVRQIGQKAWDDGKKELSNQWEQSKKDILNVYDNGKKELMDSLSAQTTKAIKDSADGLRSEISTTVKGWFSDEDQAKASAPKPVTEDVLEDKVRDIIGKVQSEKSADEFEQKVREIVAKVQAEKVA